MLGKAFGKAFALTVKKGLFTLNSDVMTGATVAILCLEEIIKKEHRHFPDATELLSLSLSYEPH